MIRLFLGIFLVVVGTILAISTAIFFKNYINDDGKTIGIILMSGAIIILGSIFLAQFYDKHAKRIF